MWGDRQTPHSVTREITREMASAGSFVRSGLAFCLEVAHPELTCQESSFSGVAAEGRPSSALEQTLLGSVPCPVRKVTLPRAGGDRGFRSAAGRDWSRFD